MSVYLNEFITIALVHLLAVASPGPDFAIVVRHSVAYGRRIAIYTSLGIGLAILVHVAYSMVGISVLLATTPWLYATFSYVAAAYLIFLAVGALRSRPNTPSQCKTNTRDSKTLATMSTPRAFGRGFLTNGLNPKATLFFLSLFTVIIDQATPVPVKLGYGVYLSLATAGWFCLLSYLLSTSKIASLIGEKGYLLDRAMGVLLIGLAVKLVLL